VTLRLRVTARAAREIELADAWWREHRQAAPATVREDVKSAFQLLLQQPGVGVKVISARMPGTRRLHLKRIGYFIYYRARDEQLYVLSVWHSSRGSTPLV
jgi:plasmid stabilization system protein ParE